MIVVCPFTAANTWPSRRVWDDDRADRHAFGLNVLATMGLTEAMDHAFPRDDAAVIVVAPVDAPLTTTLISVSPAGMTALSVTVAIDGSTTLNCTLRSSPMGSKRQTQRTRATGWDAQEPWAHPQAERNRDHHLILCHQVAGAVAAGATMVSVGVAAAAPTL